MNNKFILCSLMMAFCLMPLQARQSPSQKLLQRPSQSTDVVEPAKSEEPQESEKVEQPEEPSETSGTLLPQNPKTSRPSIKEQAKPKQQTSQPFPIYELEPGVDCRWYGHSFIYLRSLNGIRIAIDPFGEIVNLPFPENLSADVILITFESLDRSGAERLLGTPQIFRSITGIGLNKANGVDFHGVETYRENPNARDATKNIVFFFDLDNIRFCHLGALAYPPSTFQLNQLRHIDVLFFPIGEKQFTFNDIDRIIEKTQAKWIVPIAYQDSKAGLDNLRPLQDFLKKYNTMRTIKTNGNTFTFRKNQIPEQPTILVLQSP